MTRILSAGSSDRRTAIRLGLGFGLSWGLVGPGDGGAAAQTAASAIGRVDEVRGEVQAEQDGKRRVLQVKSEIFAGDVLVTGDGGLVVVKLGAATTIKLGGQSRLKVESYLAETGGVFDMQGGHMMFERRGKPASEGITFKSAYGLMAIRGTRFYAGPNRGAFALLVGEGRVEVNAGGRPVMVRPQEGIDIKVAGQPSTAPSRWSDARIDEMLANFR